MFLTSKPEPHQHTFLLPCLPSHQHYWGGSKTWPHLQHSVCEFTAAARQAWQRSALILWGSHQNREHFHFSAAGVILPNRNQNGHLSGHSFSKSHSDKSPRVLLPESLKTWSLELKCDPGPQPKTRWQWMNCLGYVVTKGAIPSTSYFHNKWASFVFYLSPDV